MKPAYCDKHGTQSFIQTSPKLAESISGFSSVCEKEIRKLQIISSGSIFEYVVDAGFLSRFRLSLKQPIVILTDRDKALKQLNDRLIIQRITSEMKWVCPVCLRAVIFHADVC